MKKVIVTLKNNTISPIFTTMEEPTQWIANCVNMNVWGKPERWQQEYKKGDSPAWVEPYDLDDVIDQEDRPDPVTGELIHFVKLKADYTIEIKDITFEHELDLCIQARIAEYPNLCDFLNAFFDGGQEALDELQAKRLLIKQKYPKPVQGE